MLLTFTCTNCNKEVFIDLPGEDKLECPHCTSKNLQWLEADMSQYGCG